MDKRFKYPVMGHMAQVGGVMLIIALWGLQHNSNINTSTAIMLTLFIIGTMRYIKEDTDKNQNN